jgi:hypothetical protein
MALSFWSSAPLLGKARPMTTGKRLATAIYNPHLLERSDLVASFVARHALFDELLDDLRRGGKQHHLLVGARGAGKTTLLLRIAYGIEDDARLARACVPLRFPEEQYNVSRPSDFWMNCIDALTDTLEQRGDHQGATKLDAEVKALEDLEDDQRATQALALLTDWAKRSKKMLVLLVDNMDIVLERLREAHWPLREALSADNRLVVIGASTTFLQESLVYESPFYDFFHVHELGPLREDEARKLVLELARLANTPEVETIIAADPGRFKALYVLTGGMPRTLALLHGILAAGKNGRVEEDLDGLLDQLTPYYKARFDDLPTQSQLIMDAVALHWHPITAADCASHTRLGVNVVSAQLDRLCRQGLLSKVALPGASKLGFQVAERFFNIWYLMRASRRLRRRLGWLVEFLRVFYGEEDLQRRAEELLATPAGRKSIEGGAAKLFAFASAVREPGLRRRLELRAAQALVDECNRPQEWREVLELDGEDAHLAPVLDRVKAMRDLRARITNAKLAWPRGASAKDFAEWLACEPFMPTRTKIEISKRIAASSRRTADIVQLQKQALVPDLLDIGPRLRVAIGRGEIPSLSDVARPDEIDDIVSLAEDTEGAIFQMMLLSGVFSKNTIPGPVITRALQRSGGAVYGVLFSAQVAIIRGRWPLGRSQALQALTHVAALKEAPDSALIEMFCHMCVQHGLADQAADLLKQAGIEGRLLPLYEALLAAAAGPNASLAQLAPEVRVPAEKLLGMLLEPLPPVESSALKDKRGRAGRGDRRTKRAGKEG